MKLDLTEAINEVIKDIDAISAKQPLDFYDLQSISRHQRYLVLLQSLNTQTLNVEKITECFKAYYNNPYSNNPFIRACSNLGISKKLYDLVLSIGVEFKISPVALIFPKLEIMYQDLIYKLYNDENWQVYQQDNKEITPQTLLHRLVEQHLYGEKNLPLDISSLKNNKLEVKTVLQDAEFIPFDALDLYLEKNPDVLAYTEELAEAQIRDALLLYPRHFDLILQSMSSVDRNTITDSLYKFNLTPTILDIILDTNTPSENKRVVFDLLGVLTRDPYDFQLIQNIYSHVMMKPLINGTTSLDIFTQTCRTLPKDEQRIYSNAMQHQWLNWTKTAEDFVHMMETLPEEDQPSYLELTRAQLSTLTKNTRDLGIILERLPTDEQSGYIKSINNQLVSWNEDDIQHALKQLIQRHKYKHSIKPSLVPKDIAFFSNPENKYIQFSKELCDLLEKHVPDYQLIKPIQQPIKPIKSIPPQPQ